MVPTSILLVEDDVTLRSLLTTTLSRAYPAAHLQAVANGLDALAAYSHLHPDLLLTGSAMPGLVGVQLIQVLRTHSTTLMIVAFSGDPLQQAPLLTAGANVFLPQPFSMSELLAAIAAL